VSKVSIKYIQRFFDKRLGRIRIIFRKAGQKRVTLPGPLGSPAFWQAYQQALADPSNKLNIGEDLRSKRGSVSAAIAAYYMSREWQQLSDGTQAMRRRLLERFREPYGEYPLSKFNENFLTAYLDAMKPHAARNALKALRGLLRHAKHDITRGMAPIKAKSVKRQSWPAEQMLLYENHHPKGSKARLVFALAKYTGAARAEIARMGPRHVRNGEIVIARQKTGVEATIPIHPELQAILDATPVTGLATFVVSKTGKPYGANDLSEQFRVWCDEAGIAPGLTLHGLRHTLGDQLAETGSNPNEVASVLGHAGGRSALHYTQGADRKRMARQAMARLIRTNEG
jgi:integrase